MKITPAPPPSSCLNWLFGSQAPADPCFVLDAERFAHNISILENVQDNTDVKILLALKAFANWNIFPMLSRSGKGPLWGTCASSVDEARLGKEKFGGEVHAFAAAWTAAEMAELLQIADHIVFNSTNQWLMHRDRCLKANATFRQQHPVSFGFRLNPEISSSAPAIYNPCDARSRLGIRASALNNSSLLSEVEGLHFHVLCEQGAEDLALACASLEEKFGKHLRGKKWLNFGGGHHITKKGYNLALLKEILSDWHNRYQTQIYIEPGEAVALNAGWLTATVMDVVEADIPTAILDVSAACHMPDVMEMPYTPPLWHHTSQEIAQATRANPGDHNAFRLAGKSCLAGDIIGTYQFREKPFPGMRLVFGDMAIYSMVKTTTFNGLRLPSIGLYSPESGFQLLRKFGYEDFTSRLG